MGHVTDAQIRAARGLVNWSVRDLSEWSGVHRNTITNFETGRSGGDPATIKAMRAALETAGVEFTNGGQPGVRLKPLESVATLSQKIDHLRERISREKPAGSASPKRGMQQLRGARARNELVKLKNRRAKLKD
jgi:hypothetical protein